VDGAHGPGHLNLGGLLPSLGCDVYMANLHKWAFAPAAAAFLWVNPSCPSRSKLHHPIVSHCYGQGLKAEVAMLGTRDYAPIFAVPAGINFLARLGGVEVVAKRNADMCYRALQMLSVAWQVEAFCSPRNLCGSMGMLGCPEILGDSESDADALRLDLRARNIVIQRLVPKAGDRLYMRVSCAVYNDWSEYETLRDAVLDIIAWKRGICGGEQPQLQKQIAEMSDELRGPCGV
jgi:selenocysteine lyase/cysteine desulfurase